VSTLSRVCEFRCACACACATGVLSTPLKTTRGWGQLFPALETPNKLITFSEPSSVEDCHATIVISRGKKKPLCEVEKVKLPWKSADGAAKGKMEIKEISSSDLDDMSVSFSFDKSVEAAQKPALEKELKASQKAIQTMFEALVAEMMTK